MDGDLPSRVTVKLHPRQSRRYLRSTETCPVGTAPRPTVHPHIREWRLNLTGLSQVHNLYFVAYQDMIYVYEPRFPDQTLSVDPTIIIYTPPTCPDRPGEVDRQCPHSINNLVVAGFGSEEIVGVVRDDGDFDAYLTRHILDAVKSNRRSASLYADNVRPFVQHNVNRSAWGLAFHAQARIVAVSSNAHLVSVFRFGLSDNPVPEILFDGSLLNVHVESPNGQSPEHQYKRTCPDFHQEENFPTLPPDRTVNEAFNLSSGKMLNIPCVAFCNTGHDPLGRWLLTADLHNNIISWDLFSKTMQQDFRLDESAFWNAIEDPAPSFYAGWGLALLNPQSFCNVVRSDTLDSDEVVNSLDVSEEVWDYSSATDKIGRLCVDTGLNEYPRRQVDVQCSNKAMTKLFSDCTALMTLATEHKSIISSAQACARNDPDFTAAEMHRRIEKMNELVANISRDTSSTGCVLRAKLLRKIAAFCDSTHLFINRCILQASANCLSRGNTEENLLSYDVQSFVDMVMDLGLPFFERRFSGQDEFASILPGLPCPMLNLGSLSVALLQPDDVSEALMSPSPAHSRHFPIVYYNNPWGIDCASVPVERHYYSDSWNVHDGAHQRLFDHDRGCCVAEVPELSILVIGNQRGTVVIYSLIKSRMKIDIPHFRSSNDDGRLKGEKTVYGLSLEHRIDPTKWPCVEADDAIGGLQGGMSVTFAADVVNGRTKLVGMSVGPVQGTESLPNEEKQFRLMMLYTDHTVLACELALHAAAEAVVSM